MQLEELGNASHTGPSLHYLGIYLEEDASMARNHMGAVTGKLMNNWWDTCAEAGSQRRPRSSFSEPLPSLEVLSVGDGSQVKNLRALQRTIFDPTVLFILSSFKFFQK